MSIQSVNTASVEVDDAFIGRRVHSVMWDRKITQTQLSQRIGMAQTLISRRLRGTLGWPAPLLVKTAAALGTSVAYLVGETDDPSGHDGGEGWAPWGSNPRPAD